MNATYRASLLALAFALGVAGLAPGIARAGANETPGVSHRPHTYSAYLPVSDEFGPGDDVIFQKYVVGHQHYSLGTVYSDNGNDNVMGGASIWNFFEFCTSRRADVMLVSTHGMKGTGNTLIECYGASVRGKAIRDSLVLYYSGIFVPGAFISINFTDGTYGILATQTFYTTYFMTPQAFCWWSTCYSSLLSMTGPSEARCYLGYNQAVLVSKCLCDDERVLSRMDGQEGQAKRPLAAAIAGINALCPDPKARLVARGKLNTVLSPSVLEWAPQGIVCSPTPGYVKFDCTLDTGIPPAAIIDAYGDGFLAGHAWAGDDKVTYTVVPTTSCPTIFYDVHEATSISNADHARLDGNTKPAVNALGPNQDDFIWTTFCPICFIPIWNGLITTNTNGLDLAINNDFTVYTPVVNMSGNTYNGTVTFHVDGLTLPIELVPLTLTGGESRTLSWVVPIPAGALPGQAYAAHLTLAPDGESPYIVDNTFIVGQTLHGTIHGQPYVGQGPNTLMVDLANAGGSTLNLSGLGASNDLGWFMSVTPSSLILPPHGSALLTIDCQVPPATPPGTTNAWRLTGVGPAGAFPVPMDPLSVHLPLTMQFRSLVDCVPGSSLARVQLDYMNVGDHTLFPTYNVQSSHGFPVNPNLPNVIQPNVLATGFIQVSIPPDPTLIGTTDMLTIHAFAEGYDIEFQQAMEITPAISIDLSTLEGTSLFTGWATPHLFPSSVPLTNHSDTPMSGSFNLAIAGLPPLSYSPSINILPHATQVVGVQVSMPPAFPVGARTISAQTAASPTTGSGTKSGEALVTAPVLVEFEEKTAQGHAGSPLVVSANLINLRTDRTMNGTLQWSDTRAWITGSPSNTYSLAPGGTSQVQVSLLLPGSLMAPGVSLAVPDTDDVSLTAGMTYDTGALASTSGGVEVISLASSTAGVGGPGGVSGRTDFVSIDPNPAGQATEVYFRLASAGRATLTVHDAAGRRVATLLDATLPAGEQRVTWNCVTDEGRQAPAGLYFIRLRAADTDRSRKVVRMR